MDFAKQVKVHFVDDDDDCFVGGILLPNGILICGNCGGLIEDSDDYEIVEEYKTWVDVSEFVIGE